MPKSKGHIPIKDRRFVFRGRMAGVSIVKAARIMLLNLLKMSILFHRHKVAPMI